MIHEKVLSSLTFQSLTGFNVASSKHIKYRKNNNILTKFKQLTHPPLLISNPLVRLWPNHPTAMWLEDHWVLSCWKSKKKHEQLPRLVLRLERYKPSGGSIPHWHITFLLRKNTAIIKKTSDSAMRYKYEVKQQLQIRYCLKILYLTTFGKLTTGNDFLTRNALKIIWRPSSARTHTGSLHCSPTHPNWI